MKDGNGQSELYCYRSCGSIIDLILFSSTQQTCDKYYNSKINAPILIAYRVVHITANHYW